MFLCRKAVRLVPVAPKLVNCVLLAIIITCIAWNPRLEGRDLKRMLGQNNGPLNYLTAGLSRLAQCHQRVPTLHVCEDTGKRKCSPILVR